MNLMLYKKYKCFTQNSLFFPTTVPLAQNCISILRTILNKSLITYEEIPYWVLLFTTTIYVFRQEHSFQPISSYLDASINELLNIIVIINLHSEIFKILHNLLHLCVNPVEWGTNRSGLETFRYKALSK